LRHITLSPGFMYRSIIGASFQFAV
jgi:hypothetical protein